MLKKAGLSLAEIKRSLEKGIDDSLIRRFDDWGKGRDGGQMPGVGLRPTGRPSPDNGLRPGGKSIVRGWTNGRDCSSR